MPLYGVVFMCFPTKEAETKWLGYEDMNDNYAAQVSVGKSEQGWSMSPCVSGQLMNIALKRLLMSVRMPPGVSWSW